MSEREQINLPPLPELEHEMYTPTAVRLFMERFARAAVLADRAAAAPRELTSDEASVMDAALLRSGKIVARAAAPAEQKAEPVPVAWMGHWPNGRELVTLSIHVSGEGDVLITPLFASPPRQIDVDEVMRLADMMVLKRPATLTAKSDADLLTQSVELEAARAALLAYLKGE